MIFEDLTLTMLEKGAKIVYAPDAVSVTETPEKARALFKQRFLLSILRGDMKAIMAGYVLFLFMDFAGSIIAFTVDKAPYRYIWLILIQRFFYRQFMYLVAFKSIIAMIKGRRHGWNKLDRTNSIKVS